MKINKWVKLYLCIAGGLLFFLLFFVIAVMIGESFGTLPLFVYIAMVLPGPCVFLFWVLDKITD